MSAASDKTKKTPLSSAGTDQITLIVPTRNEADNIAPLLQRLAKIHIKPDFEILFVDDSRDQTAQVIADLAVQYPFPIRLLARPPEKRNGLSGAVVDGFREAQGNWICVMDADLQHPPEAIPLLWEQAEKTGADIVVGSRRGDVVGPLGLTRMRSLNSKVLTILARMIFPRTLKNVSDPLTGLFLVRRSAVTLDVLRPDGFKILLEILVRCPELHVSEITFDFAPRNEGESKADVREGMRFFRHLMRLRVTVNPHLVRFLVVIITGTIANTLLLWALVDRLQIDVLYAAILAVEIFFLWMQVGFHYWVFRDKEQEGLRRGFWVSFLASQFFLVLIYIPLLFLFSIYTSWHYLLINLLALLIVGLIRYGLSEQWIWTKGSMVWQYQKFFYSLHNVINIESQVPLEELQYFQVFSPPEYIDIQVRLDRQGTPSRLPGGISYDESLGRFGFGLTVLPGEYTQIVVSPLLERSPHFLFTNVIEPVIRWNCVRKGYALIKAAAVSQNGLAVLIQGHEGRGKAASFLCSTGRFAFMGDDLVIISDKGKIYSYPKPVTVQQEMIDLGDSFSQKERLALLIRRTLYTQLARKIGLWLSAQNLPAATLNTYLQWWVPQPKQMLGDVVKGIKYAESADLAQVISLEAEDISNEEKNGLIHLIDSLQQSKEAANFQPHPILAQKLRDWQGEDLLAVEREIIEKALGRVKFRSVETNDSKWWLKLDPGNNDLLAYKKSTDQNEHTASLFLRLAKPSQRAAKT